jgi:hypothetical protein
VRPDPRRAARELGLVNIFGVPAAAVCRPYAYFPVAWSDECLNWSIVTRAHAPRQVTPAPERKTGRIGSALAKEEEEVWLVPLRYRAREGDPGSELQVWSERPAGMRLLRKQFIFTSESLSAALQVVPLYQRLSPALLPDRGGGHPRGDALRRARLGGGHRGPAGRAPSHCRFVPPLIHFIPYLLIYLVYL